MLGGEVSERPKRVPRGVPLSLPEWSSAARQFWAALVLLSLLVAVETAYYYGVEGRRGGHWTLVDAFYMAVMVVTTLGTMEVHPLSQAGRIFTSLCAGLGVGMLFGLVVPSATSFFLSQLFTHQFEQRRRLRTLEHLSEHYIVCGYGRMGREAVTQLLRRGLRVAVIEQNEEAVADLRAREVPFVVGNAAEDEFLRAAGIARAKGIIAAVGTDEDNVFITLSARLLNPALYIVVRASREENVDKLTRAGANRVLSPFVVGGRALAHAAAEPGLADFIEMVLHREDIDLEIASIPLPPDSPAINQPMQGSGVVKEEGAMIVAIMDRDGQFHTNPYPLSTLTEGDRLIAMGTRAQLEGLRRTVGWRR